MRKWGIHQPPLPFHIHQPFLTAGTLQWMDIHPHQQGDLQIKLGNNQEKQKLSSRVSDISRPPYCIQGFFKRLRVVMCLHVTLQSQHKMASGLIKQDEEERIGLKNIPVVRRQPSRLWGWKSNQISRQETFLGRKTYDDQHGKLWGELIMNIFTFCIVSAPKATMWPKGLERPVSWKWETLSLDPLLLDP